MHVPDPWAPCMWGKGAVPPNPNLSLCPQLLLVVDAAGKFCLALNGVPLGPFHASGLAWPCLTQLGITGDLRLHRVLC